MLGYRIPSTQGKHQATTHLLRQYLSFQYTALPKPTRVVLTIAVGILDVLLRMHIKRARNSVLPSGLSNYISHHIISDISAAGSSAQPHIL